MSPRATSLRLAALLPLTLLLAQTLHAQKGAQPDLPGTQDIASERRSGNNFHYSFASSEFASDGTVVVRGVPFTAVAVSETVQTLSDGSRVPRGRTARIFRDGEGRVRLEFGSDAGRGGAFTLYDAVSGVTYVVGAGRRAALRFSPPAADDSTRRATVITPQSPPLDVGAVVGEKIEPIGRRVIEGVEAEGVRVTSPLPANAGGGERPGRVVYERWYSHELRRDVLIRCTDPRFGEAVFRLTEIRRAEPSADLFRIPADYRVEPAFGRRERGSKTF